MADRPPVATRLNHVAYPTFDTPATVRFYTEIMGFPLVDAIMDESDPEGTGKRRFLHTFFAMGSGEIIAFFDVKGLEKPKPDKLPPWVRHLALAVDSREQLLEWKQRLESHGLHVAGPVDHDGTWLSIYFPDPNGVTLELTWQSRALTENDAREAAEMVARWTAAER